MCCDTECVTVSLNVLAVVCFRKKKSRKGKKSRGGMGGMGGIERLQQFLARGANELHHSTSLEQLQLPLEYEFRMPR